MIPFVGGSHQLRRKKADTQRTVNMFPSFIESGSGKARMFLKSIPGLREFSVLPLVSEFTLSKEAAPEDGVVGSILTYTITATNDGPDAADGKKIIDALPAAVTFSYCTIAYSGGADGPLTSTLGGLAAGVAITTWPVGGVVTVTVVGTLAEAGELVNTATVGESAASVAVVVTAPETCRWLTGYSEPIALSGTRGNGSESGAESFYTITVEADDFPPETVACNTDYYWTFNSIFNPGTWTSALSLAEGYADYWFNRFPWGGGANWRAVRDCQAVLHFTGVSSAYVTLNSDVWYGYPGDSDPPGWYPFTFTFFISRGTLVP